MDKPFLRVVTIDQAQQAVAAFQRLESIDAPLEFSLARVIAQPVQADEDMPAFNRSTMDGFAVRAADTFGASESLPGLFDVVGEVAMGEIAGVAVSKGQAVRIWTGGALPEGADAVVMVEHTQELDDRTIEVYRPVAPLDNVVSRGEDFERGEILIPAGRRLRAQDLGLLAAMGHTTVEVIRRPVIGVISSGDEIVPVDAHPAPGCMRDINRYTISSMVREAHAEPLWIGIARDTLESLNAMIERACREADAVLISGGSSMGSRDLVVDAILNKDDSEIMFHGVSISPGKPFILGRIGRKPVVGLPGHPVSAMVCAEQLVIPLIGALDGEDRPAPLRRPTVEAVLGRNVASKEGRTDFVRVRLERVDRETRAIPVLSKSGLISAMVRSHGYVRIGRDSEGLYKGDAVTVYLHASWKEETGETKHLSGYEASSGGAGALSRAT